MKDTHGSKCVQRPKSQFLLHSTYLDRSKVRCCSQHALPFQDQDYIHSSMLKTTEEVWQLPNGTHTVTSSTIPAWLVL